MPVDLEAFASQAGAEGRVSGPREAPGSLRIGLINNMPDAALQSTEAQFGGLLNEASGGSRVQVRLSSFPELPRSPAALEYVRASYWPLETLLAQGVDALIVTGTEPRAPRLSDEPYWERFGQLLSWSGRHTLSSVWSCLAAHAAVQILDGIERRRLAQKRCGVYEHRILQGHPLLAGIEGPLCMPHSRWNELSAEALAQAGYTILSSAPTGADAFAKKSGCLLLFFQGHPEYEDTTLLREYRRDVGRYLSEQQPLYPTLPCGYLSAQATACLEAFREHALRQRSPQLMEQFPFAQVAAALNNSWHRDAVALYRNWLQFIIAAKTAARDRETLSLSDS